MELKQKDANHSVSHSVVDFSNTVLPVEVSGLQREPRLEVQPGSGSGRARTPEQPGPDDGEGEHDVIAVSPALSLDDWVRRELADFE